MGQKTTKLLAAWDLKSHLTPEQARLLWRKLDKDYSGELNHEEAALFLKAWMRSHDLEAGGVDEAALLNAFFDTFDANKDGYLSMEEIVGQHVLFEEVQASMLKLQQVDVAPEEKQSKPEWRLICLGQSMVNSDLTLFPNARLNDLIAPPPICCSTVAFSSWEGWIGAKNERTRFNGRVILPGGQPCAMRRLVQDQKVNLIALANNHAYDGGPDGVEQSIKEAQEAGALCAGVGCNLESANSWMSTTLPCGVQLVLLAHATGALPPNAAADINKPGVNELKVCANEGGDTVTDEADATRILAAIAAARAQVGPQGVVIVSHHNHQFSHCVTVGTLYHMHDKRAFTVPDWQKKWSEQVIEAGATAYLGHGNPNFGGMGLHKGRPVFYSLGNFIFEIQGDGRETFGAHAWQGITADVRVCPSPNGQELVVRISAISIDSDPKSATYGLPSPVNDTGAMKTLHRFVKLSKKEGNVDFVVDEHRRSAVLSVPYVI
jgi:hypothetical protein